MMDEEAIREQARERVIALKLGPALQEQALAFVATISLSPEAPYCRGCESILCGACGECHGLDLRHNDLPCPTNEDEDDSGMGMDCAAWFQAHKALYRVQRDEKERA